MSENYLDNVKTSCYEFVERNLSNPHKVCWIDDQALEKYVADLDGETLQKVGSNLGFTFNHIEHDFKGDICTEAGFIFLLHAIDFGGGFRQELHKFHGKGAFQTIHPGAHNILKENLLLRSDYFEKLTLDDVKRLFCLNVTCEDGLDFFVQGLLSCLNEIGRKLTAQHIDHLGDLIVNTIENEKIGSEGMAAILVKVLVQTFPLCFDDCYEIIPENPGIYSQTRNFSSVKVCFYKKAQLVTGEIYHILRGKDERFNFKDGYNLTAYIDNVICAVLRKLGIVSLSSDFVNKIEKHEAIAKGTEFEVSFRAHSLVAIEKIVTNYNLARRRPVLRDAGTSGVKVEVILSATEVGNYFWGALGKLPEFRKFNRHAIKDTVFY